MRRFLWSNSPGQKPELWQSPLRALWRHAVYRSMRLLAPDRLDASTEVTYDTDLRLAVQLRESVGRPVYLYGSYEYSTTRLLDAHVLPGMCVFDVGANIGYYSLIAGKRVGPGGAVYAFEPSADVFQKLEANLHRNASLNIHAYPLAVCDRDETVRFHSTLSNTNAGTSSLIAPPDGRLTREVLVPGVTLDHFVEANGIRHVHLMKVDVEGAELDVFRGAARLLERRGAPDIIFECHGNGAAVDFLRGAGYAIYTIRHRAAGAVLVRLEPGRTAGGNRFWEAPNLFATKELADRLGHLCVP